MRVTLATREAEAIYSGMLPGLLAGRPTRAEATVDLLEMLRASGVGASLDAGAVEVSRAGFRSTSHPGNEAPARPCLMAPTPSRPSVWRCCCPQTAGGLLAGVPAGRAGACLAALRRAGDARGGHRPRPARRTARAACNLRHRSRIVTPMRNATGVILMVQESRFRLLTEAGRGLAFVLSSSARFEPQDLAPLVGRRARVDYRVAPGLLAGEAHDIILLDA